VPKVEAENVPVAVAILRARPDPPLTEIRQPAAMFATREEAIPLSTCRSKNAKFSNLPQQSQSIA